MKAKQNTWRRMLTAEQLERRELLASDFCCHGAQASMGPQVDPEPEQVQTQANLQTQSQLQTQIQAQLQIMLADPATDCPEGGEAQLQTRQRISEGETPIRQQAQTRQSNNADQDPAQQQARQRKRLTPSDATQLQKRLEKKSGGEAGDRDLVRKRDRTHQDSDPAVTSLAAVDAVIAEEDNDPLVEQNRTRTSGDLGDGVQKRPGRGWDTITSNITMENSDVEAAFESAAVRGKSERGQQNPTNSPLSSDEAEDIRFIREEEKLARDVYIALGTQWGAPIFDNIAESESQHMAAVKTLIDKYGLEDPVGDDLVGDFSNPILQQLYDALVSNQENIDLGHLGINLIINGGAVSELDAYKVGAFIEEFDILDIQHALEDVSHSDIQNVYENLLRGSRNHLRSFVAQIENIDGTYVPVLMTGPELDAQYSEIVSGNQETGGGNGRGGRRL